MTVAREAAKGQSAAERAVAKAKKVAERAAKKAVAPMAT